MTESTGRVAIVTGSESGIGRAIAVALARQGCDVGITWYRDEEMAEGTAAEVRAFGRRAEVRHLDLTRLPDAADVVDELAEALGGVDVLVNDAGTGHVTPLLDLDLATWREVLATDLDGAFLCLQRAARRMVAAGRGGRRRRAGRRPRWGRRPGQRRRHGALDPAARPRPRHLA